MYLPVNIHFQLIIITNVSIWSTNIRKLAKDHKGSDSMTKICKKAAQHFHCAVSKVFDRVKSVALWFANIRKLAKDHKGYGSATDFTLSKTFETAQ
jgi:predicted sugar kinase